MKYNGTKIDGPGFDPEQLSVRGKNLNEIVAGKKFIDAIFHLLKGEYPTEKEYTILENFCTSSLSAVPANHAVFEMVRRLSFETQDPIKGIVAGLLFELEDEFLKVSSGHAVNDLFSEKDVLKGIFTISLLPLLICVSKDANIANAKELKDNYGSFLNSTSQDPFITRIFKILFSKTVTTEEEVRLFESLLISWHAGFGFLTPSILAPRVAAGTGVSSNMVIVAGIIASGPYHIGASQSALSFILSFKSKSETNIADDIKELLQKKQILYGFGHPLFKEDPRVATLFSIWSRTNKKSDYLQIYSVVCEQVYASKKLKPNIDFITAAILADIGCSDPFLAPVICLLSRSVGMIAHASEKKQKPAFGGKSADFRTLLSGKNINEFSFE
jgi:citrate synthase